MRNYAILCCAVQILIFGALCFYCMKYDISKDSKLHKYRPSKNSILLRWKLFKDDKRFNYFLIIPYLIAWNIFIVVFIIYVLWWCGISYIENILSLNPLIYCFAGIMLAFMIYLAIIEQVIDYYNK